MREDLTCSQNRELLEGYAIGALEEDEQRAVERHLETCPDCRAVAAELVETAHALPLALGAVSPLRLPASLKGRVLQAVARDGGATRKRGPRRFLRPRVALALAALAVVAGFSAWNAHLSSALSQERSMRERLAQLVGRQETVLDIVDAPKARRAVLLPPPGADSRAYGKVFTAPDVRDVVALAARLRQPAAGQTYRLWLTSAGRTHSAGRMVVNAQGFALVVFKAERRGPAYDQARVVLQAKDAASPAGTTVLVWRSGD